MAQRRRDGQTRVNEDRPDPRSALQLKLQGGDRATRAMEIGTGQQEEHGGEQ